ncbi:lasso peptide biosynthesis B2 protein [Luteimonas sp. TWI1416]|uniref:lasso peptide biosynthesis B2 protein n=1 Tax=unclassified Luteimonas TaxID=2629088 RepID=UPI00320B2F0C
MPWQVSESISFCELDDRLFFLDLGRDRYFQLSETLERRFRQHLHAPDDTTSLERLIEQGLCPGTAPVRNEIVAVEQSVPELTQSPARVRLDTARDIGLAVLATYRRLTTQPLGQVLNDLTSYRCAKVSRPSSDYRDAEEERRLIEAADAFNLVRPYIPIATSCVIDSVSMIRFLAKRGLHAHLVMGVACDPFSAHAWVQCGSLVLNDSIGSVQGHVPIRVL